MSNRFQLLEAGSINPECSREHNESSAMKNIAGGRSMAGVTARMTVHTARVTSTRKSKAVNEKSRPKRAVVDEDSREAVNEVSREAVDELLESDGGKPRARETEKVPDGSQPATQQGPDGFLQEKSPNLGIGFIKETGPIGGQINPQQDIQPLKVWPTERQAQELGECSRRARSQKSHVVMLGDVKVAVSHPDLLKNLRPLPGQECRSVSEHGMESDHSMKEWDP